MAHRRWIATAALFVLTASLVYGQGSALTPAQASPFLGTWVIEMTEPAAFRGTHTVRVWEKTGAVVASLQAGKFPATEATGVHRDGSMLVLTITHDAKPQPMMENGAPIWVVAALTLDGDSMKMALMLERSETIKRGTGRKQM
jgi:hypothetical protein